LSATNQPIAPWAISMLEGQNVRVAELQRDVVRHRMVIDYLVDVFELPVSHESVETLLADVDRAVADGRVKYELGQLVVANEDVTPNTEDVTYADRFGEEE